MGWRQKWQRAIAWLILSCCCWTTGCTAPNPSTQPPQATPGSQSITVATTPPSASNLVIQSARAETVGVSPLRIQLHLDGYQPDACDVPITVEQARRGDRITVTLRRQLPADAMCPQQVVPYQNILLLDGTFEHGWYQFQVNDYEFEAEF